MNTRQTFKCRKKRSC